MIGPNGSGKSTLLRAIAGLSPYAGSIDTGGRSIALVLQSTDVDRSVPVTVRDTVAMARYPSTGLLRRFRAGDREIVARAMARLDVDDLADRQLHDLSGGQRQRVLVAQGLAQEAEVLLLDEPVNGLDIGSRQVILDVISEERAAGRIVVMTTHSLDDAGHCDLVVLLDTVAIALDRPTMSCVRSICAERSVAGSSPPVEILSSTTLTTIDGSRPILGPDRPVACDGGRRARRHRLDPTPPGRAALHPRPAPHRRRAPHR